MYIHHLKAKNINYTFYMNNFYPYMFRKELYTNLYVTYSYKYRYFVFNTRLQRIILPNHKFKKALICAVTYKVYNKKISLILYNN